MRRVLLAVVVALALGALLALAWWGWRQGGLRLLMPGMGVC